MPAAQPGPVTSAPGNVTPAPGNVTPKPTTRNRQNPPPGTGKGTAVRCDSCDIGIHGPMSGHWKCNSGDCHCNEPEASGTGQTGCSDGSKAVVDLSTCSDRRGLFAGTYITTCSSLTAVAHCENQTCSDGSTASTKISDYNLGNRMNRMNAGYEPETTTQGL